ncbi:MAG: PDC sensor domain-containing protein [Methanoculleaceae archaeon]
MGPCDVNDTTTIRHAIMHKLLHAMTCTIQDDLDALNFTIDDAASTLSQAGLSGPKADAVVRAFASYHPAIMSVITVDSDGTVLSAAPDSARVLLGQNIADQDAISHVFSTGEPVMGKYFSLRQGGEVVAIVYPVVSPDGEFIGAVSMAFSPSRMITRHTEESKTWAAFTYIVTQPDSVILSHSIPKLEGKQIFDEPFFERFPGILTIAKRCITERTGYMAFSFYQDGSEEIVPKETFWDTVELHGTEWRVRVVAEKG